jgi:hypothetical protein
LAIVFRQAPAEFPVSSLANKDRHFPEIFRTMNRFVSQRSVLFIYFAWCLTLSLFADAANIDDLCASAVVLHDDEDVGSATDPGIPLVLECGIASTCSSLPHSKDPSTKSDSSPATPSRVIVDQDSPSLAAEWRLGAMFESLDGTDYIIAIRQSPPVREALYLRFCSLLI